MSDDLEDVARRARAALQQEGDTTTVVLVDETKPPAPSDLAPPRPRPRRPPQPAAPAPPPKRGTRAWFLLKRAERARREEAREVAAELERAGVTARVLKAAEALKSPFYHRLINTAIKRREAQEGKLTRLDPVRAMVLRILEEDFDCDVAGVDVAVRWEPAISNLAVQARPAAPAIQAAVMAVAERRKQQKQQG